MDFAGWRCTLVLSPVGGFNLPEPHPNFARTCSLVSETIDKRLGIIRITWPATRITSLGGIGIHSGILGLFRNSLYQKNKRNLLRSKYFFVWKIASMINIVDTKIFVSSEMELIGWETFLRRTGSHFDQDQSHRQGLMYSWVNFCELVLFVITRLNEKLKKKLKTCNEWPKKLRIKQWKF